MRLGETIKPPAGGGGNTSDAVNRSDPPAASTPFSLVGDVDFYPEYSPGTIRIRKSRQIDTSPSVCGGEDVSDGGSKNRRIHIVGQVLRTNISTVNSIADSSNPFMLTSATWSGEVRVDEVELEGPLRHDPLNQEFLWEYTLDLVSTGIDEENGGNADIISTGE